MFKFLRILINPRREARLAIIEEKKKKLINKRLKQVQMVKSLKFNEHNNSIVLKSFIKDQIKEARRYGVSPGFKSAKDTRKKYAAANYKREVVFHGGCLDCELPKIVGIGAACKECMYFNWTSEDGNGKGSYEDRSKIVDDENFQLKYAEYFI